VKNGLEYMKKPAPMAVINNWGKKDLSPFGCESIESQEGKYKEHRCGGAQSCRFEAHLPEDGIDGERYMTICRRKADLSLQSCPSEDNYPWLGDHCGGNVPCIDCVK